MDRKWDKLSGRFWMTGFADQEPGDDFLRAVERFSPRAIILFRHNLPGGGSQVPAIRRRLEAVAGGPLVIFVDEEGGWIQQLDSPAVWPSPRAMAMGGTGQVRGFHSALGLAAAACGVDSVIAPLADVDGGERNPVIGSRSFGGEAQAVSRAVEAATLGLLDGGVLPVLKHFPGHGDSTEDSHLTLPTVSADRGDALIPFQRGINAGATAVMTAHLRIDGDDDSRPVTYREDLVRGLLRDGLGFRGLVITDALEMLGAATIPIAGRGVAALAAGCNLLCLGGLTAETLPGLEGLAAHLSSSPKARQYLEEADQAWQVFLGGRRQSKARPLGNADADLLRADGIFRPGGGKPDALWDGELAVDLGLTGSWHQEEYREALEGLPCRFLENRDRIGKRCYVHVCRSEPSRARLEEMIAQRPPAVFTTGPWGWTLRFPRRLACADGSPRGLRFFLDRCRRSLDSRDC